MPALLTARELREKRANLFQQADEILTRARQEGRELTSEEREQFDRLHAEIDRLGEEARRIERHEELQRELEESRGVIAGRQDQRGGEDRAGPQNDAEEEERAFRAWLRGGVAALTPEQRAIMERRSEMVPRELRALSTGTGTAGGYTVPQGFERRLEEALLAYGGMLEAAEVIATDTGAPLVWPTANDTTNTGELVAENTAVSGDTGANDPSFGQVVFGAYMYSSRIVLVPVQLLQDNAVDLEGRLASWLGTRIGRIINNHFTVGTGTGQPRGVVTAAALGVTASANNAITYEELIDLEHSVDPEHRRAPGVRWMFHDSTLRQIKRLKDNDGRPIWLPGIAVNAPDTILGYRYIVNQDVPQIGPGAKAVLFGDFQKYKIRVARGVTLLRLTERYAEKLQVGFLAFARYDGNLVDAGSNPIKYLQMAA